MRCCRVFSRARASGRPSALTSAAAPRMQGARPGGTGQLLGRVQGLQLRREDVQAAVGSVASYGCERFTSLEKCLSGGAGPGPRTLRSAHRSHPYCWKLSNLWPRRPSTATQFDSSVKPAHDPDRNFSLRQLSEHRE